MKALLENTFWAFGIHLANVARKISSAEHPLFAWAQERSASASSGDLCDGSTATVDHPLSSLPMLPPALAHDQLSLIEGSSRHAFRLFFTKGATEAKRTNPGFCWIFYSNAGTF